ncbi:response regulator transcription factor [Vulcanococcus limneticus]|uniref:response regulator transcription factor n=1 Tax=Vulcanococcus limneticus TaxID=2170428 RepID=UPI00398BEA12
MDQDPSPSQRRSGQRQVVIIDDDPRLRQFLCGELEVEGYAVREASDGQSALIALRENPSDVILLDLLLPDFSGVEVCRRIRASGITTPIVMLTGRDGVQERVEALDSGADDFMLKPFSVEELLARLRAHLRRSSYGQEEEEDNGERLIYADLILDTATREVSRSGEPITLSVREFELLRHLMASPNRVLERQAILRAVWGENHFGDDNLLDVYVRYLRRKLEPAGRPTLIQTVRGVGFMLREGDVRS